MSRKSIIALATLAAVASLTACSSKSTGNAQAATTPSGYVTLTAAQLQHIRLYTVAPSQFHKTVETNGVVDFDNDQATSVLSPVSGPVARLLVHLGDRVKRGDPLAAVDSPDFAAAIGTYRKSISAAQTARRLADLDKDLIEHHGIAEKEARQAESDAIGAEADREAALKALVSLQVPSDTIKAIQEGRPVAAPEGMIRAPISGTVAERLITPGQLLQAGTTPCFTVADLSRVWVMAQIFGSDLGAVAVGDAADVVTGIGTQTLFGTVDNIASVVDPDTRAVAVRVLMPNPGGLLKKQMYVRVLIHARQESTGVLVPVAAILRDDENLPFVYASRPDSGFAREHVTLGYRVGDQYEVTGLQAGERIVVDGGIFVQFMQNQ